MNRSALRQTLLNQLQEDKGEVFESLDDNVNLRDGVGLDSIDVVSLVLNIQSRFGIELRSEELEKIVTVGDLIDLLLFKLGDGRRSAA